MGVKKWFGVVSILGISAVYAAIPATEVVTLPSDAAYGGGDKIGSQLVAATYNAGEGPGIWIVADGGYRLYHNGALLAEDNQAGRVRFVPMTFLPGENAVSVVGVNGAGAPGVMVQIDDLDKSYYSGGEWKSKPTVGNASWKNKGRDLSQWGGATTLNYASNKLPSGAALNGFAANTQAKWIWTSAETDPTAVLLFTFYVRAEGFGASTTGGDAGNIVVVSDSASIRKYLQSNDAVTILVPEGTYDFRQFRDAATEANAAGRTWCTRKCSTSDVNKNNTFYRINFAANTCSDLNDGDLKIVSVGAVKKWDEWITIRGNKSLIGMGRGANLRGASLNNRKNENAGNNIFRNLAIYDINPHLIEAGDGLEVSGNKGNEVENIWFDHISYKWISDGMDLEHVKGLTVSYVDYDGANDQNCYYYDPYMHLVENAQATLHHMYWHNSFGRVPKVYSVDGGKVAPTVHVYNSYVEYNHWHIIDVTGTSSTPAQLLYENNYIGTANIQIAGKNAYGKVMMKNNVVKTAKNSKPYDNNGTGGTNPFTDNVFTPGYSYSLMNVNNIPNELPKLAGVGGRYGKMPEYNQGFGQSNKAASVNMTAPAAGTRLKAGSAVTLKADAKDNDGSVKSVAFYVGNTLVGTANAAPYQVNVEDVAPGTYSAVAVVTDNSGLTQMSEFVTFVVEGAAVSSSSSAIESSSSSVVPCLTGDLQSSSSSVIPGLTGDLQSSSSTTALPQPLNVATEAEAGFYRIFDMQGRPLFAGYKKPAKMPAARVIVVEYTTAGSLRRRYLQ